MLLCAGILGRYYTDAHNVDEDLTIIPTHGGVWNHNSWAGIAYRCMDNVSTNVWDSVASRQILYLLPHYKNTLIILYLELC